jgi:hypothetical protein
VVAVTGLLLADDLRVDRHLKIRDREAGDVRVAAIELFLHRVEILAGGLEDRARVTTVDADGHQA